MAKMGLQFGLESKAVRNTCLKKYRWMFVLTGVSGDNSSKGLQSLPPSQSARPSLSFNEIEVKHVNENFFLPGKPDWKPIQLMLFDLVKSSNGSRFHPVFEWIKELYNPFKNSEWNPPSDGFITDGGLTRDARLEMYDGCGKVIETWIFENVWPQAVDFGSLDMANNEIVTCDLTLRYARSYLI